MEILKDEDQHVDELEELQDQMDQMSLQIFSQRRISAKSVDCVSKPEPHADMRFLSKPYSSRRYDATRKILDDNGPQLLGDITRPANGRAFVTVLRWFDNARKLIDRTELSFRRLPGEYSSPPTFLPHSQRKVRDLLSAIHNLEKVFDIGKIIIGMPVAERKQVIGVNRKQLAIVAAIAVDLVRRLRLNPWNPTCVPAVW